MSVEESLERIADALESLVKVGEANNERVEWIEQSVNRLDLSVTNEIHRDNGWIN